MLRSANENDPDIAREVLEFPEAKALENPSMVFEHGRWWLVGFDAEDIARTFAVEDCRDSAGNDYLDLEEL